MATQEDIERLFALFCEAHPQDSLREMDKTSAGQGAVLRYLASVEEPVTSGQIAQALGGSTARMAVLLKKLEAKGLIRQYTVVLDEKKLGNDLTVFVSVRLENPRCGEAFARAASAHPNISECYYIAGDVDYLLKIVTDSSRSLELIHEDIKAMEGVAWTKTLYVLSTIKNDVSVLPGEV